MKKAYVIGGILVVVIIIALMYMMMNNASFKASECEAITDTSARAECYKDMAAQQGDIRYCEGVSFYVQWCLEEADPNHHGDKQTALDLCQTVTDSSTRADCLSYVEENY